MNLEQAPAVCGKLKNLAAFLLVLLVAEPTFAQESPAKTKGALGAKSAGHKLPAWKNEPDSFLGIKFGQPFNPQIPPCPEDRPDRFCSKPAMTGYRRELANPPDVGVRFNEVWANLVPNGNFEGMRLTFQHASYPNLRQLFIAKYGDPTAKRVESYTTRAGASFRGEVLLWIGKNATLSLYEYSDSIAVGGVTIFTEAYSRSIEDEKREAVEKNKGKL